LLSELGLSDIYKGVENIDGEFFNIYEKDHGKGINADKRPFKAFLDVGLVRTTTGNRVFGAMKGAIDGGVFIPHNTKRFPGYHIEKKEVEKKKGGKAKAGGKGPAASAKAQESYNAKEHRDHIFGAHV